MTRVRCRNQYPRLALELYKVDGFRTCEYVQLRILGIVVKNIFGPVIPTARRQVWLKQTEPFISNNADLNRG